MPWNIAYKGLFHEKVILGIGIVQSQHVVLYRFTFLCEVLFHRPYGFKRIYFIHCTLDSKHR